MVCNSPKHVAKIVQYCRSGNLSSMPKNCTKDMAHKIIPIPVKKYCNS